jgi:hypothetical protein
MNSQLTLDGLAGAPVPFPLSDLLALPSVQSADSRLRGGPAR